MACPTTTVTVFFKIGVVDEPVADIASGLMIFAPDLTITGGVIDPVADAAGDTTVILTTGATDEPVASAAAGKTFGTIVGVELPVAADADDVILICGTGAVAAAVACAAGGEADNDDAF